MYTRVFALLALFVGLAHSFSWDIVVAQKKQLKFYYNGNLTYTENITSAAGINSVTYDPVHNRILLTNYNKPTMSAFSFDLTTKEMQPLFVRKTRSVSRVFYEPVTQLFFWKETKNIYSKSLRPETCNETVLFSLDHDIGDIAVDSCEGYIYWVTDYGIERARFNGTEREVLVDVKVYDRRSVAIDQQRQKMYWIEKVNENDLHLSIKSIDFKANKRTSFEVYTVEKERYANSLTVTKDFIYWIGGKEEEIWQLPKNQVPNDEAKLVLKSHRTCSFCQLIAAKYTAQDQTQEIGNCKTLDSLIQRYNLRVCVHGTEVDGDSRCECEPGYTGERCDESLCNNYCLQGYCELSAEGQPKCSCNAGYSGERCEVNKCGKLYCLNGGDCSLNETNEPICKCTSEYKGNRCEVPAYLPKWIQTITMFKDIIKGDMPSMPRGNEVKPSSE